MNFHAKTWIASIFNFSVNFENKLTFFINISFIKKSTTTLAPKSILQFLLNFANKASHSPFCCCCLVIKCNPRISIANCKLKIEKQQCFFQKTSQFSFSKILVWKSLNKKWVPRFLIYRLLSQDLMHQTRSKTACDVLS